ncbi:MAG: chemotaxis protein CheA [Bacteroidota bacterium]
MEDFRKLFYEEAVELISKLEENLMLLEDDLANKEHVDEIFRIMHSLKGSGAMFGFTKLSSFTHDLETLYDHVRSKKLNLNSNIVNFTINAVDHIKDLLKDDDSEKLLKETQIQKELLNNLLNNEDTRVEKTTANSIIHEDESLTDNVGNRLYYIKFEPGEDIFNDGTNPLYIVDELDDLGDSIVQIKYNKLPEFRNINPEKCYVSWVVILSTTAEISEIDDVFIFVEEDSNIIIETLSEKDLFSISNAKTTFEYLLNEKPNEIASFKRIAHSLETELLQDQELSVIDELEKQESIAIENNNASTKSEVSKDTSPKEVKLPSVENIETVKVSSKKLDSLINLVSELVTAQARLLTIANNSKSVELADLSEDVQRLSRQFRDIAFDMRLIPIQTMLVKFKRLVRDLSKNLNKKVNFETEGTETELDKSIIATLSDPVMHIIRNAIDHGIETPEVRLKNGKQETGTIHLRAQYSGASILITIKDDGAGINSQRVLQKAINNNFIKPTDELSTDEIYNLLMLPGFSTSETVSDVSGRGVGLDVVRKKINELRGEVSISSETGKGTKISLRLPLTLLIIDGLLVSINNTKFVIPLSSVQQIYQVTEKEIKKSFNNIIDIEGIQFPFVNLTKEFEGNNNTNKNLHFVSVSYHGKNVGLIVNELISEYQAVLKPIGNLLQTNEIFAGASILGDGKVALVLDTNKTIDFYTN